MTSVGDVKLICYSMVPIHVLCRVQSVSGDGWITCETYSSNGIHTTISYYNFWNMEEEGAAEIFSATEEDWMVTVMKGRYEREV